jgi:uncharacterized tellurite resistance protein B-like protein
LISDRLSKNFRMLAAAAWSKGKIADEEMAVLLDVAREQEIPAADASRLVEEAEAEKDRDYTQDLPPSDVDRAFLFVLLVRVVAADGQLDPKEADFLKKLGPHFGYKESEVEMVAQVATQDARDRLAAKK